MASLALVLLRFGLDGGFLLRALWNLAQANASSDLIDLQMTQMFAFCGIESFEAELQASE